MPKISITQKDIDGVKFISEPGEYEVTIINVNETLKDGNPNWKLTLETEDGRRITTNLLFDVKNSWRIAQLVKALGYELQAGEMEIDAVEVKGSRVKITVTSGGLGNNGQPFMNVRKFDKATEAALEESF
jgi:hypothetical protein